MAFPLLNKSPFKAFNENTIKKLYTPATTVICTRVNNTIYANNENRKFCTNYDITTSFKRKGRVNSFAGYYVRNSAVRTTRPKESFGSQKQHYSLAKVKSRNRNTLDFSGIHTTNVVCMVEKVERKKQEAA